MVSEMLEKSTNIARHALSFFIPVGGKNDIKAHVYHSKKVAVIIPTYKPKDITYRLVKSLLKWNSNIQIILVDDNTPKSATTSMQALAKIRNLKRSHSNLAILYTKKSHLKANALNFGLSYIAEERIAPQVVITFDDDVVITKDTVSILVDTLYAHPQTGAVVSNAWVKNKKKNILTRLQSLEYHGFNMTKIGDTGFLWGPLVMQGMLSAFRYKAIKDVGGFRADRLIEDYDITVRIKNAGWKTAIAPSAHAWTTVPETMGELWRQRVRWSYGGIIVVKDFWREFIPVFQDIVGHILFISLFFLIIVSLFELKRSETPPFLVVALLTVALLHFALSVMYNIISLLTYTERDRLDWFIKLSLIPEFVYSNVLSAILVGSYLFFIFNTVSSVITRHFPKLVLAEKTGLKAFQKLGFSLTWGTRG